MYRIIPQNIPQDRRAEINDKILFAIDTDNGTITPEMVYNCYTGIGGLHNLQRNDYGSYHQYAEAKKELEMGQFFTPHNICREMVELLAPSESDMILEMCCGMGNFINYLPNQHNVYGFDVDGNAINVARYLYPDANLQSSDMVQYSPDQRFDAVIGNPPFNLKCDGMSSQYYYVRKAYKVLNPAGLLMMIVPHSFLVNEFWEKSTVTAINRDFSFIGQTELPSNAFASVGVTSYQTKIMVFIRESRHIEMKPYNAQEFVSMDVLRSRIMQAKESKDGLRLNLIRESTSLDKEELEQFDYKLSKYLYELKSHRQLRKHYQKAIALIAKFRNQRPPENCSNEEFKQWDNNKLTPAKVLSIISRYIRNQNVVHRKEVALIKTNYGFKLKGYAPHLVDKHSGYVRAMYDLVLDCDTLPKIECPTAKQQQQFIAVKKLIGRKKREYEVQSRRFSEMESDPALAHYLSKASFINKEGEVCHLTKLQQSDLNLILQKHYSLLNWQQGSGKTAAIYHYAKYLMNADRVRNTVVLAPAIATNLTWRRFLQQNKERFLTMEKISDFDNIPQGVFVVVSISMLDKFQRHLKKFVRARGQKICLLFDESDEITNPNSARTLSTLNIFRRCKYKVLATGTTTRNNINELYSQLELLYNNSVNMMCRCDRVYKQNKDGEIESKGNQYYGMPFPAYRGSSLFKHCFCPGRATVFGIEKQNQDILNKNHLFDLVSKTIITRKFKEFAGEKYNIHTHSVEPSEGEYNVYRVIMEEFCRICEIYYNNTGDTKKEAGLRMMRQIKLLIRACSTPHLIEGYFGDPYPSKVSYVDNLLRRSILGKVAIGCTELKSVEMYRSYLEVAFPDRPIFIIRGEVSFKRRESIIRQFESTINGILICTQQSLKSSANIPTCNDVIIESLQWNIPKMEQFYFRFIRLDSKDMTRVHFVSYQNSIEQNLLALVLTKERLNEFIKTGEVLNQSEIFDEFDVAMSVIDTLLVREQDSQGKFHISWGNQRISQ